MNKKLFLLGFVSAAMPINDVMGADELFQSGFYTGLSGGYTYGSVGVADSRSNTSAVPALVVFAWNKKSTGTHHGVNGDINLGYRYFLNDCYMVGLSTSFGLDSNKISKINKSPKNTAATAQETVTKLRTSYKFTPAFVFGAKLSDALLLTTELGVGLRRFKVDHSFDVTTDVDPAIIESFSKTKAGFSGKVTLERAITSNVSVLGSVGYEYYGTVRKNLKVSDLPNEKNTLKLTPTYVTTNVGVMYRF